MNKNIKKNMDYTKERPLRVFEAFAGYGSQLLALRRLERDFSGQIKVVPVGFSEIDPYAIKAYKALHGDVRNYGDISKIDWSDVPDFDLFTMSSPCQDFSQAGLMKGGEEGSGTRSSLLWECSRAIEAKRPQYVFFENVSSLVGRKFIKGFHLWQERLEGFGYKNFANVLDATDYGVAQHRERIYMVSILRTEENPEPMYFFPKPFPLVKRMKDYLETNVDEKYYISDKVLEEFQIEKEEDGSDADGAGCGEGTDGRGAFTQTSIW